MKNLMKVCALLIVMILNACDVVELEAVTNDEEVQQSPNVITGPTTVPADEETFLEFLHANESKTWVASEFTIMGVDGFQDCRLDDAVSINSDGTYTYDSGARLCGQEDSKRSRTGTWTKVPGENKIVFDMGDASVTGLDSTGIVLSGSYGLLPIKGSYVAL